MVSSTFQSLYFNGPVLALLIICCSNDGIKPITYDWSTSCGNFPDINSYHTNNITSESKSLVLSAINSKTRSVATKKMHTKNAHIFFIFCDNC